jgi:fatty acid synthase subunit alpha
MPAGFNAKKAGDHLATVGLAGGSVDSVMLHALASEPAARIPDDAKAKAFLDECAQVNFNVVMLLT